MTWIRAYCCKIEDEVKNKIATAKAEMDITINSWVAAAEEAQISSTDLKWLEDRILERLEAKLSTKD